MKEDIFHLNNTISVWMQENNILHEKLIAVGKENAKFQQQISEIEKLVNSKQYIKKTKSESFIVMGFKSQIDKLKNEINHKEQKLNALKKNANLLKLEELEIENQRYLEEIHRLKKKFEINYSNKKEKINDDYESLENGKMIENLKKENIEIIANIKFDEEENLVKLLETARIENEIKKDLTKIANMKKNLDKKDYKIKNLNIQLNSLNNQINEIKENKINLKRERLKNEGNIEHLRTSILNKEEIIQKQRKNITDLEKKLKLITEIENKEIEKMKLQLRNENEMTEEVEKKYLESIHYAKENNLIFDNNIDIFDKSLENIPIYSNETKESVKLGENCILKLTNDQLHIEEERRFKKVPSVKLYEIEKTGLELNMRFRLKKLEFETIEKRRGEATILEIFNSLNNSPFLIENEEERMLVARYMVEENYEDHIDLDLDRTTKPIIAKTILKKLVGSYQILLTEQEAQIRNEICQFIKKYKSALKQSFEIVPNKKNPILSGAVIKDCIYYLNIDIPEKLIEYILLQLFSYSNNIEKLEWKLIFDIFEEENEGIVPGKKKSVDCEIFENENFENMIKNYELLYSKIDEDPELENPNPEDNIEEN